MRHYAGTFTALFLILLGLAIGQARTTQNFNRAKEDSLKAGIAATQSKSDREKRQTNLDTARKNAAQMEKFLASWSTYMQEQSDPSTVQDAITDAASDNDNKIVVRRSPTSSHNEEGEDVIIFPFNVRGDYGDVINWLSTVEAHYPLSQFQSIEMRPLGTTAVTLDIKFRFCDFEQKITRAAQ